MTARIIPFMRRSTAVEWRYRESMIIDAWWSAVMAPARFWFWWLP